MGSPDNPGHPGHPHHPGHPGHPGRPRDARAIVGAVAVVVAVAGTIVAVAAGGGSSRGLGNVEFVLCVLLLVATLVATVAFGGGGRGRGGGGGGRGGLRERFVEGARAITNDIMLPVLDGVVRSMSGKTSKDQREKAAASGVSGPSPDGSEPPTVLVTPGYLMRQEGGPTTPEEAQKVQLEYKRIGFLLCQMRSRAPADAARVLARLGFKPSPGCVDPAGLASAEDSSGDASGDPGSSGDASGDPGSSGASGDASGDSG